MNTQPTATKTSLGLTVSGTRITLYDIMDYIKKNRNEVDTKYKLVLKETEENRQHWESRNRERFAQSSSNASQTWTRRD